ncbi:MAG TPA: ester cyclase [Anaerolineales bacterium]|nr:ester cyclase [Anaerolineales bacterium]
MSGTNRTIALQTMEALDQRDLDRVRLNVASEARFYGWAAEPLDPDGHRAFMSALLTAFPDSRFVVDDVIAEGDKVAVRHRLQGTHQAELQGVPATGRQVEIGGMVIFRIENGKVEEAWLNADIMGMMQQLGVVPA